MKILKVIPNVLTAFHLLAAFMVPYYASKQDWLVALGWGVSGFLSDLADGAAARKFKAETHLGKIADPIVDVIFDSGVIVGAILGGFISGWMATYLIISAALLRLPAFFTNPKSIPYKVGFISGVPYGLCMVIFVVWPYLSKAFGNQIFYFLAFFSPVAIFVIWLKRERIGRDAKKLLATMKRQ